MTGADALRPESNGTRILVLSGVLLAATILAMATTPVGKIFGIEGLNIFDNPTHGGCDPKGLAKIHKYLQQLNDNLAELRAMQQNPAYIDSWDKIDREIKSTEIEKSRVENAYGNCPSDGDN